eukprot:1616857-Prymnesium_polylepis.1
MPACELQGARSWRSSMSHSSSCSNRAHRCAKTHQKSNPRAPKFAHRSPPAVRRSDSRTSEQPERARSPPA